MEGAWSEWLLGPTPVVASETPIFGKYAWEQTTDVFLRFSFLRGFTGGMRIIVNGKNVSGTLRQ